MAKPTKADINEAILVTLQNSLIVRLAQTGLDNHAIAKIAGIHVTRVIPVATLIKRKMKRKE